MSCQMTVVTSSTSCHRSISTVKQIGVLTPWSPFSVPMRRPLIIARTKYVWPWIRPGFPALPIKLQQEKCQKCASGKCSCPRRSALRITWRKTWTPFWAAWRGSFLRIVTMSSVVWWMTQEPPVRRLQLVTLTFIINIFQLINFIISLDGEDGHCVEEFIFASVIGLSYTDGTDEASYLSGISSRVSDYCHDVVCELMDEAGFPCPDDHHFLRKGSERKKSLTKSKSQRHLILTRYAWAWCVIILLT